MYLLGLVERTQAAAANLDLDLPTILKQGLLVYVGLKARLRMAVGVTDVVAAHSRLIANVASHIKFSSVSLIVTVSQLRYGWQGTAVTVSSRKCLLRSVQVSRSAQRPWPDGWRHSLLEPANPQTYITRAPWSSGPRHLR